MGILEFILISVIIVLVLILIYETREYRKTKEFTRGLQEAINAYTIGYNTLAATVQAIEKAFEQSIIEHTSLAQELNRQSAIMEVHNRALNLNSRLLEKPNPENPIP